MGIFEFYTKIDNELTDDNFKDNIKEFSDILDHLNNHNNLENIITDSMIFNRCLTILFNYLGSSSSDNIKSLYLCLFLFIREKYRRFIFIMIPYPLNERMCFEADGVFRFIGRILLS